MTDAYAPIFRGRHGDYVARQLLRETRRARVLRCVDRRTGTDVVLKASRRRNVFDRVESAFYDRFADFFGAGAAHCLVEHEAFALQHLDDPRVVTLIDYGFFEDLRFIVIENLAGESLRSYTGEPWPASSAHGLATELLLALECLRIRNVVHRDLRPEPVPSE